MKGREVDRLAASGDVAGLIEATDDESGRVRSHAVEALADVPGSDAREALVRVCTQDPEIKIRLAASEALLRAGDERAIYGLASLVTSRERERIARTIAEAARLLGAHRVPAAVPALVAGLEPVGAYDTARLGATTEIIKALGALGDVRAVEHIGPLLDDPQATAPGNPIAKAAIDALVSLGGPEASGWFLHVLHRGDEARDKLGTAVIDGLERLGDPTAADELAAIADGRVAAPRKVRHAAERAVATLRQRPPLAEREPPDSPMRDHVAGFVIDLLAARLREHPDPAERAAAARALGRLDDERVVPALQSAFGDPSGDVASAVAAACADFGGVAARNALLTGLRTSTGPAQVACAAALADAVADEPDGEIVDQLLADAAAGAAYPDDVRVEIAYALAQSPRADARAAVEAMIDQGVRLAAARTLAVVADDGRRTRLGEALTPGEEPVFVIDDGHHVIVGLEDRLLHAHGRKVDVVGYESIHVVDLGAHRGSAGAGKAIAMTAAFGIVGAAIAGSSGGTAYVTVTGDGIRYELKDVALTSRAWTYLLWLEDRVVGGV
jgi:HEAT repeat protein